MIEYKILAIPSEMPQKFIVGYRKQEDCLVYCPSYKYASEEEDRGHNETARDAGFDISEGELDVLGGGITRFNEKQDRLILTGSSGAYGAVPSLVLSRFADKIFHAYQKVFLSLKAIELHYREDYVKPEVRKLFESLKFFD